MRRLLWDIVGIWMRKRMQYYQKVARMRKKEKGNEYIVLSIKYRVVARGNWQ
jgi:hypothetical protein